MFMYSDYLLKCVKAAKADRQKGDYCHFKNNQEALAFLEDESLKRFSDTSAKDILKELGPISKQEVDCYENL